MKYDEETRLAEVNLWHHYDRVFSAAERLIKIASALGLADNSDQSIIIEEIMKMGDRGNGIFSIDSNRLPTIREAGLIRIIFDWDASQMSLVPEFLFSLEPLDI